MEFALWMVWALALVLKGWAQKTNQIDCTNDEPVTSVFMDPVELTWRGTIKIYENVAINQIKSTSNNEFEHNYIDARLEADNANRTSNLILFATEHFANYAQEQTATRISLKINLDCGMGKQRVVPLKEGNYFSPVFSQRLYEFIVPTPIFAGFDLTAFLQIAARDADLTHNHISFASHDSWRHHIRVGTNHATSAEPKTFYAKLTLEKILMEVAQPIEFEIVATDSGEPAKSSTASVIIRSDPQRSLPPIPEFNGTLHRGFIALNFSMDPIQIQLRNGTYTQEVEFSISGVEGQEFQLRDHKNGSIAIVWNPTNLNKSDVLKHKMWELTVRAQHKSLAEVRTANVLVEMMDVKSHFHFISSYHEGSINEMGELQLEPIVFNRYAYQSDIVFTLQSLHGFFLLARQNFSIQLHLNTNFTWQAIENTAYLRLTLHAQWQHLSSSTNVVIKVPQTRNQTVKQTFEFEKPVYVGQLNEMNDLELEAVVLKTDVGNAKEIEYNLSGNGSERFFLLREENRIQLKPTFGLVPQPEIKYDNNYLLILEAKHNDMKAYTSVAIKVPHAFNKPYERQIFSTPCMLGSISLRNASQVFSLASISVATAWTHKFAELNLRLTGEYAVHFSIEKNQSNHAIALTLRTPIPSPILAAERLLNFSLQAEFPGPPACNDTLMLFIALPQKECPAPAKAPPHPLQFSSTTYVFNAFTHQTGALGMVKAFGSVGNATLLYLLGVQSDLLAQRLAINPFTGELTLYGSVEEGDYLFNITAENVETQERAVAKALLKVQQREECKVWEAVTVEKALMFLHVDEEKPNYGVFDLKFNENCTFHIVDIWPNDKEYVHVNYIFNMLDMIAIDREDEIFQNMSEPHIKVKLKLRCDKEDQQRNLTIDIPKQLEKRSLQVTFTEDIPYSPDIMWLYIKIDDINDNPPEFVISDGPIYLGYPSGNAAFHIYPEYLTQIEAFDRDVGFNAEILFTMRDNAYFDIEPQTGKIYPKGDVLGMNEQTELIVLATDQYGEGLVSATVVLVKGLSSDFYSFITLKGSSPKTKQQLEQELSRETGYIINILKMAYVPQELQQRSNVDRSLSCKAWIYAYDQHQLVTYKAMQQMLVKRPEANVTNLESYNEAAVTFPPKDSSIWGYLIATIVLSLTSCCSLFFIIWRFCYKPAITAKCDGKTSILIESRKGHGQQQNCTELANATDKPDNCRE